MYSGWTGIEGLIYRPYVYHYPVTTAGCNITDASLFVNISTPVFDPSTWNPKAHYRYGKVRKSFQMIKMVDVGVSLGHVDNNPTMQFFTGISRSTQ